MNFEKFPAVLNQETTKENKSEKDKQVLSELIKKEDRDWQTEKAVGADQIATKKITKEKILSGLSDFCAKFYQKNDAVLNKLAEIIEPKDLGKAGGQIYELLARNSLWQPEKEFKKPDQKAPGYMNLDTALANRLSIILKKVFPQKEASEENKYLSKEVNDSLIEKVRLSAENESKSATIKERVDNIITGEGLTCNAKLSWKDKKSGKKVDFDKLLPPGYSFSPGIQSIRRDEFNATEQAKPDLKQIFSLKEYSTEKHQSDYYAVEGNKVYYGDLSKNGASLSLLHEIAHTWQFQFHNTGNRTQFKNSALSLQILFEKINNFGAANQQNKEKFFNKQNRVDAEWVTDPGAKLKDNEFRLSSDISRSNDGPTEVVSSSSMAEKLNGYIHEERDAWAHAIRLLRYFRKQGLDLEPGLKSSEDINKLTHECLASYQRYLELMIADKGLKYDFLREQDLQEIEKSL